MLIEEVKTKLHNKLQEPEFQNLSSNEIQTILSAKTQKEIQAPKPLDSETILSFIDLSHGGLVEAYRAFADNDREALKLWTKVFDPLHYEQMAAECDATIAKVVEDDSWFEKEIGSYVYHGLTYEKTIPIELIEEVMTT